MDRSLFTGVVDDLIVDDHARRASTIKVHGVDRPEGKEDAHHVLERSPHRDVLASIHHNEVEAGTIGIKADGRAWVQFLPVLHQHAILHDDVVAAADELMNLHIARLVVEREPKTDVEHIARSDRGGMVGK